MSKNCQISTPTGTTGLACEPWGANEIYAVAANWAQASSPVLVYADGEWTQESHGRQVADFRHDDRAALESIIREAIKMGGDEPDDDEVESILDDANEIDDETEERAEMVELLERHGDRFTGNHVEETAQEWLDHDFTGRTADDWCEIGVWDCSAAAAFRDANLTPDEVKAAAERLVEENGRDDYTDGCPIYSVCNGDTGDDEIIDAAKEVRS